MREINLFGRLGNKDNDIKFFLKYLPKDIKNVIEPFGGTFACIKKEYNDDKYNKYVNDLDDNLYLIYTNPELYLECKKKFNEIAEKHLIVDSKTVNYNNFIEEFNKVEMNIKLKDYIIRECIIRGRMVKINKTLKTYDFKKYLDFHKKINFTNDDYKIIIDKFKYNEDSFIILDPPYLFSDNNNYKSQRDDSDMSDIMVYILELFNDEKVKCKLLFIINKLKIISYLFKNYIVGEYEKIYQIAKKKETHLIIAKNINPS